MGYTVELMNADTESKADVARTQAEKLIRDGAQMLVGAFESGGTMAIAQVCEQQGVPFVINIGADPQITEQGFKFTFRNFPTSPMLGMSGLWSLQRALPGDRRHAEDRRAHACQRYLRHVHAESGHRRLAPKLLPFKIIEVVAYDPQARDLSIEVAKAKAAKADLHMVVTRHNDAILMVREMVKQRYEPMGIISPGSPGMYERQFGEGARQIRRLLHLQRAVVRPQAAAHQDRGSRLHQDLSGPVLRPQHRLLLRGHPGLRRCGEARGFDQAPGAGGGAQGDQHHRPR